MCVCVCVCVCVWRGDGGGELALTNGGGELALTKCYMEQIGRRASAYHILTQKGVGLN